MQPPHKLLLAFYGDDFTGSTDAMEFLEKAGLRTMLFMDVPTDEQLRSLEGRVDAIGIAGSSRSLPTDEMESVLRPVFQKMRRLGAPIIHYKICSTFDSSPKVGSIGKVFELGTEIFASGPVPLVVGAPVLGRYCVFGNLFARSGLDSEPYRLDRHPTMQRHPITPMSESDLRLELAKQTDQRVELLNILQVASGPERASAHYRHLAKSHPGAILIDLLLEEQLETVGELLSQQAGEDAPLFVVGSSGVEMALGAWWNKTGRASRRVDFDEWGRAEPLLVLSGSCSPVTQNQNQWALSKGFVEVALDTPQLFGTKDRSVGDSVEQQSAQRAIDLLKQNRSVIIHTALGPDDPRLSETYRQAESEAVKNDADRKALCSRRLGAALGRIGRRVLSEMPLRRVTVTGGDTSGQVASQLGIDRLEMLRPMAPGSPLCRAHAHKSPADGVQFVFKGGQVGKRNLIEQILVGKI